jgi:hypothetical protein
MDQSHEDRPWERRRYWQGGKLVRLEWWWSGASIPAGPPTPPLEVVPRDYCYQYGTPIYPNLCCPVGGERPAWVRR